MSKAGNVIAITSAVFIAEALIHYNIGVNKDKPQFKLEFPKGKELVRVISVVVVAAYISRKLSEKYA